MLFLLFDRLQVHTNCLYGCLDTVINVFNLFVNVLNNRCDREVNGNGQSESEFYSRGMNKLYRATCTKLYLFRVIMCGQGVNILI